MHMYSYGLEQRGTDFLIIKPRAYYYTLHTLNCPQRKAFQHPTEVHQEYNTFADCNLNLTLHRTRMHLTSCVQHTSCPPWLVVVCLCRFLFFCHYHNCCQRCRWEHHFEALRPKAQPEQTSQVDVQLFQLSDRHSNVNYTMRHAHKYTGR